MIIGFSGYAQTGKSTSAQILVRDFHYVEKSFAGPLKESLLRLDPYIGFNTRLKYTVDTWGWEFAKKYPECRELLQRMGTEVGREMFGEDFWVDQALRGTSGEDLVTFSDVRFKSEASAIKDHGGKIIRIERDGRGPVNGHKSETELDDWAFDWVVQNNGTLDELAEEVNRAMQSLR